MALGDLGVAQRLLALDAGLLEGEFLGDARLLDVLLGLDLGGLQGASARDLQLAGFLLGGDAGAGSLGLAAALVAPDLGSLGRPQGLERAPYGRGACRERGGQYG